MKHGTLFVKWLPIWFQHQSTILYNGEGEQYKISKQLNFVECSFWPNFTASASRVISGPFVQCNVNVNFGQSVAWNVGHWPMRGQQSTYIEKWSLFWRIPVKVICRWFVVSRHKTDNKADNGGRPGRGNILRHFQLLAPSGAQEMQMYVRSFDEN